MVLLATRLLLRVVRPFAISLVPRTRAVCLLLAACFARRITHVNHPAALRRRAKNPAISGTCDVPPREREAMIGYTGRTEGVLQQRPIWALRDLTMAFSTRLRAAFGLCAVRDGGGQSLKRPVHPHKLDKPALAVSDEAPQTAAAAAPAQELPPIGPKLAGANVEAGKAIFQKQCFTCHTVDKGGANKVGPNLWDIVGRKKASHAGFAYSWPCRARAETGPTRTSIT